MSVISIHRPAVVRRSSAYGSLECRFAAYLIDTTLFLFLQSFAVYFLIGYPFSSDLSNSLLFPHFEIFSSDLSYVGKLLYTNLYFILIHWLYYALMECSVKQGTIGKIVLGLQVTNLDNRRITFTQASLRYFAKYLSIGLFLGGFMVAFFNRKHQTLHDIIAGTTIRVVKR